MSKTMLSPKQFPRHRAMAIPNIPKAAMALKPNGAAVGCAAAAPFDLLLDTAALLFPLSGEEASVGAIIPEVAQLFADGVALKFTSPLLNWLARALI